jgi:hypothetical protein
MKLEDYLQGRDKVNANEVLIDGQETRTSTNFPIVPTKIVQEAFIANLTYSSDGINQVGISIPLIRQSTDHKSIIPGFDQFNISSSGLGISYSGLVTSGVEHKITYSIGISLPTGSIS